MTTKKNDGRGNKGSFVVRINGKIDEKASIEAFTTKIKAQILKEEQSKPNVISREERKALKASPEGQKKLLEIQMARIQSQLAALSPAPTLPAGVVRRPGKPTSPKAQKAA